MPEDRLQPIVRISQWHLEIDAQLRNEIIDGQMRRRDRVEPRRELGYPVGGDGHAGRRAMAAVTGQEISAFGESGVEIKGRDRSARSLALGAVERDQHRRPAELL